MKMNIWKADMLRHAIVYMEIIEDMQTKNPEWYLTEFRKHENWEIGLTMTIEQTKEWLRKWHNFEEQGDDE